MTERTSQLNNVLVSKGREVELNFTDEKGCERYVVTRFNGWSYDESRGELVISHSPRKTAGPLEVPRSQFSDIYILSGEQIAEFEAIIPLNGNPHIKNGGWMVTGTFTYEETVFVRVRKNHPNVDAEMYVAVPLGDFLRLNKPEITKAA